MQPSLSAPNLVVDGFSDSRGMALFSNFQALLIHLLEEFVLPIEILRTRDLKHTVCGAMGADCNDFNFPECRSSDFDRIKLSNRDLLNR